MSRKAAKQNFNSGNSVADTRQLEALLLQTESELEALQPTLEKMEAELEKLKELKLQKQKLITLKLSLKSILNNFSSASKDFTPEVLTTTNITKTAVRERLNENASSNRYFQGTFLPDVAFERARRLLKKQNSINFELFRAIVFNGGQASTEQIRQYLVENRIAMPGTGQFFDDIPLTDISSRVNYLIRKGLVTSGGRGVFVSTLGWENPA